MKFLKRFIEPSSQAGLSALLTLLAVFTGRPEITAFGNAVLNAGDTYTQTGSKAAAIGAVVTGVAAIILKEKGNKDAKN